MTSNLGSQLIQERLTGEFTDEELEQLYGQLKVALFEMLRQSVRPEFLNRIDEIVLFKLLNKKDLRKIVDLQLKRVKELLARKEITMEVTDDAKDWLARLGYDPTLGARPLKRVIQKHIVNKLSEHILSGDITDGDSIEVRLDKRGLIECVKKEHAEEVV
jgi:ATP-dependent Clp protease ATP-binding subunit ClpB